MGHTIYPRAAVAVSGSLADTRATTNPAQEGAGNKPVQTQVLWAAHPLDVRAGRLIGVRLRGTALEVALVAPGANGYRWVAAVTVLTAAQADVWSKTTAFTK